MQDLSCNRLTSLYIAPEGAALAAFLKEKNSSDPNRSGSPAAPSRVSALASMPNLCVLNHSTLDNTLNTDMHYACQCYD
jgi:hypothetical protein